MVFLEKGTMHRSLVISEIGDPARLGLERVIEATDIELLTMARSKGMDENLRLKWDVKNPTPGKFTVVVAIESNVDKWRSLHTLQFQAHDKSSGLGFRFTFKHSRGAIAQTEIAKYVAERFFEREKAK